MKNTLALLLFLIVCGLSVNARAYDILLSGETDVRPWSGYWWPTVSGELVNGYYHSSPHPSPLEKYDLYTTGHFPGPAVSWGLDPKNRVFDRDALNWNGFCHAWASAALYEQIDFVSSTIDTIFFSVADKKGLITLSHDNDLRTFFQCSLPEIFHQTLLEYIGEQGIGLAGDLDSSEEFWSYPIYRYEMEVTKSQAFDSIKCTIFHAEDQIAWPGSSAFVSGQKMYYYKLYKDETGAYTSGEWMNDSVYDHPGRLWIPVSPATDAPLDYDVIRSIAEHRNNSLPSPTRPGHYTLMVGDASESLRFTVPSSSPSFAVTLAADSQSYEFNRATFSLASPSGETLAADPVLVAPYTFFLDDPTPGEYELSLQPHPENENQLAVHVYLDVAFPYVYSLTDATSAADWIGLAMTSAIESYSNDVHLTYYYNNGLPAEDITPRNKSTLEQYQQLCEVVPSNSYALDHYMGSSVLDLRVSSSMPLNILKLLGSGSSLYGVSNVQSLSDRIIAPSTTRLFQKTTAPWYVFNADAKTAEVSVDYYTSEGFASGNAHFSLESHHAVNFPNGKYPGDYEGNGWALLNSSALIQGFTNISTRNYIDSAPFLAEHAKSYVPHVASGESWETLLTLINPHETSNIVNISFSSDKQSHMQSILLEPFSKHEIKLTSDYLAASKEIINTDVMSVQGDNSVAGYVTYIYNGDTAASIPLLGNNSLFKFYILPHVASNSEWWTGLALANYNQASAKVTLSAYDVDGNFVRSKSLTVAPGAKSVATIANLFQSFSSRIATLSIESTVPLCGFVLYGDLGFSLLSGSALQQTM